MKYIKTYEDIIDANSQTIWTNSKESKLNNATLYLEQEQPVTENEGFIDCAYGEDPIDFSFYFKDWTSEETLEKFYNFLEKNNIKNYETIQSNMSGRKIIDITFTLSEYKIKKYAELYIFHTDLNKYNL